MFWSFFLVSVFLINNSTLNIFEINNFFEFLYTFNIKVIKTISSDKYYASTQKKQTNLKWTFTKIFFFFKSQMDIDLLELKNDNLSHGNFKNQPNPIQNDHVNAILSSLIKKSIQLFKFRS